MAENTFSLWAHHSFNPWIGCDKVAPECQHCYIARNPMFADRPAYGTCDRTKEASWRKPLKWQKDIDDLYLLNGPQARLIFSCSLSDFFHAGADEWRAEAWKLIRDCPYLVFTIFTKRPERIIAHLPEDWGSGYPNVWLGVTAGCRKSLEKMNTLRAVPCSLRFVCCEPLLEDISAEIDLTGFGWVLCGGESGEQGRVMNIEWAARLRNKVKAAGLPFMFKQITARYPETAINALGKLWTEIPFAPTGMTWKEREQPPKRAPYFMNREEIRQLWESHGADVRLCDCDISSELCRSVQNSESAMRTNYRERVKLPPFCTPADEQLEFRTSTGLVLAHGYVRVEFGARGPYIEFSPCQTVHEAIKHMEAKWVQYSEFRSTDASNVKLYFQKQTVTYANYVPGMWYISPFDLTTDKYPELVAPISSGVPLLPGLEMYG